MPNLRGGGAERVAVTLLNELVARGHELDLVVMRCRGELVELVRPDVRIFDLRVDRARSLVVPFMRYLRARRPDAIQASMWPITSLGILTARLARSGARIVVSDHAVLSQHFPRRVHHLIRHTIRLSYPLAHARVAVSWAQAGDLARMSRLPRDFFTIVANPISFPKNLGATNQVESLWGRATKRILTVGELKAEKDHAFLIRAFGRLLDTQNAKLIILGRGPLEADLKRQVRESGIDAAVFFHDHVLDPWPFYASADLFVLSSQEESFGNVLVEALYAGLPIVSTDTLGACEVLGGGRWGRIVTRGDESAFADAMSEQLGACPDPAELRRRAEKLSGQGSVDAYANLLLPPVMKAQ